MSEPQIEGPARGDPRWRRLAMKMVVLLAIMVIWQGSVKRATPAAYGTYINSQKLETLQFLTSNLRVATFNIAGGVSPIDNRLDLSRTAKYLGNDKGNLFNIVGLQEVHGGTLSDWRNQAQILGTQELYFGWLFAPVESRWWHDDFGNGILCDLPVTKWERLPLSTSQSESNRNMLRVFCIWHGKPLAVIVTHLDRHADHDIELGAVIASFYDTQEPVILLGDLNVDADPNDPQLGKLRADPAVTDTLGVAMGDKLTATNDWIFARGLKCVSAGLTDNDASDHKLAWAELK